MVQYESNMPSTRIVIHVKLNNITAENKKIFNGVHLKIRICGNKEICYLYHSESKYLEFIWLCICCIDVLILNSSSGYIGLQKLQKKGNFVTSREFLS